MAFILSDSTSSYGKMGNRSVQPVLQHCCKNLKVILCVLPGTQIMISDIPIEKLPGCVFPILNTCIIGGQVILFLNTYKN